MSNTGAWWMPSSARNSFRGFRNSGPSTPNANADASMSSSSSAPSISNALRASFSSASPSTPPASERTSNPFGTLPSKAPAPSQQDRVVNNGVMQIQIPNTPSPISSPPNPPSTPIALPLDDSSIRFSTHKRGDPAASFPSDDDGYVKVRDFLFTILTIEDWGLSTEHPAAVRATVEGWIGTGWTLRSRYKEGDLDTICPESFAENVRRCVRDCVVREVGRLLNRGMKMEIDDDENEDRGRPSKRYTLPYGMTTSSSNYPTYSSGRFNPYDYTNLRDIRKVSESRKLSGRESDDASAVDEATQERVQKLKRPRVSGRRSLPEAWTDGEADEREAGSGGFDMSGLGVALDGSSQEQHLSSHVLNSTDDSAETRAPDSPNHPFDHPDSHIEFSPSIPESRPSLASMTRSTSVVSPIPHIRTSPNPDPSASTTALCSLNKRSSTNKPRTLHDILRRRRRTAKPPVIEEYTGVWNAVCFEDTIAAEAPTDKPDVPKPINKDPKLRHSLLQKAIGLKLRSEELSTSLRISRPKDVELVASGTMDKSIKRMKDSRAVNSWSGPAPILRDDGEAAEKEVAAKKTNEMEGVVTTREPTKETGKSLTWPPRSTPGPSSRDKGTEFALKSPSNPTSPRLENPATTSSAQMPVQYSSMLGPFPDTNVKVEVREDKHEESNTNTSAPTQHGPVEFTNTTADDMQQQLNDTKKKDESTGSARVGRKRKFGEMLSRAFSKINVRARQKWGP